MTRPVRAPPSRSGGPTAARHIREGRTDRVDADLKDPAAVPERPEASCPEVLDPVERVRHEDIDDVADADINVYGAVATKGRDGPGCPDRGKPRVEGTQFPRLRARVVTADRGAAP
ncbi:hypothetical protein ACIA6T_33280 [Streptomyces sp. NPDC051740]|uniref:hypothetical protein n=1 Tax=Streptomyces sp. NPDC051740 TaxID=3365673 RepID=UPI00379A9895